MRVPSAQNATAVPLVVLLAQLPFPWERGIWYWLPVAGSV